MSGSKTTQEKQSAAPAAFREGYLKALRRRPMFSDEEFLAETEVSDEQYAIGITIVIAEDLEEVIDERE